jgi:hypothetical protein
MCGKSFCRSLPSTEIREYPTSRSSESKSSSYSITDIGDMPLIGSAKPPSRCSLTSNDKPNRTPPRERS